MKKLLSETLIYGLGAILPRVIVFLLNPLYINFINPGEFAQFTNLYALISFVNIFLTFGFETAYFRFAAEKDMEKKTFNTSFWFVAINAAIFLAICLLFTQSIAGFMDYGSTPEYIRWMAWIAFFDAVCIIPFAYLRFHNKPIVYSVIRVAQSLIHTVFVIALFLWIPREVSKSMGLTHNVSFTFYSNLIGSLFGIIMLLPILLKVRFEFVGSLFKRMIKYAWPVMIAGLAFMINENLDKAMQLYLIPAEDAGAYGGAYKLAVLMTLFVTAYRMGIEPYFFKQMNEVNAKETYAKITEYFTYFASCMALGLIANISWLKTLFIPNASYWTAVDIIPIIIVANLFFGIYYNLSTWYKVTDRTLFGTYISWIGALFTLVLNFLFLKEYGFMVSAYVTLGAYFLMMVLSYFLGQKYYPIPYPTRRICLTLAGLIGLSFVSYQLFNANLWIGNGIFLIFTFSILYSQRGLLKKN